jgi:plastocyanin
MSNVSELIRSANPVPETNPLSDDEVNAVLTLTLTRSGDMDVQEIMTPVEADKPRWSGWRVAAASFGVVVFVAGLALLLTRSTTEELPPATTPTTIAVDAAPTSTTSAVVQAGPVTVEVEAYDYGFRGIPAEFTAGDAIELVNTSATEYHSLAVVRLDDDDVRSVEYFATLEPEAFDLVNGTQPAFQYVGTLHAAPGEGACDVRIRLQTPGRYLLLDMVRQGADPAVVDAAVCDTGHNRRAPYTVPGGPLGYEHGMIAIVTVTTK